MCLTQSASSADQKSDLVTQQEIRRDGLEAVVAKYKLKCNRHRDHPELVQLRYRDSANMSLAVPQECRGLILDESKDWAVVALPYHKFFNHKEKQASDICWDTARVYPKLDGSVATLYHHKGGWKVATSSLPDASGSVNPGTDRTFSELFWDTFRAVQYSEPDASLQHMCFVVELLTEHNRIICEVPESQIVLHGARDVRTLEEVDHTELGAQLGWQCTRPIPHLRTLEDCLQAAALLNPLKDEGFVVADGAFNRIKIKSPAYVAIANNAGAGSHSGCILASVVARYEVEEYVAYFAEYTDILRKLQHCFSQACDLYEPALARLGRHRNVARGLNESEATLRDTAPRLPRDGMPHHNTVYAAAAKKAAKYLRLQRPAIPTPPAPAVNPTPASTANRKKSKKSKSGSAPAVPQVDTPPPLILTPEAVLRAMKGYNLYELMCTLDTTDLLANAYRGAEATSRNGPGNRTRNSAPPVADERKAVPVAALPMPVPVPPATHRTVAASGTGGSDVVPVELAAAVCAPQADEPDTHATEPCGRRRRRRNGRKNRAKQNAAM